MNCFFRCAMAPILGFSATLGWAQGSQPVTTESRPLVLAMSSTLALSPSSRPALSAYNPPEQKAPEYKLAAGDAIKVQVYQNPDLTLETRVSETGTISFPLVGSVEVG